MLWLGAIRTRLQTLLLRGPQLALGEVLDMELIEGRTLHITEQEIEEMLAAKKGAYTFIVLSILYPHLKFEQVQFHQDHIHPWSQFSDARLRQLGLDSETAKRWQEDRDRLPNLQLMEGAENKSKNDTPFESWIETLGGAKGHFIQSNRIPAGVGLTLAEFEAFSSARKELLRQELRAVLTV